MHVSRAFTAEGVTVHNTSDNPPTTHTHTHTHTCSASNESGLLNHDCLLSTSRTRTGFCIDLVLRFYNSRVPGRQALYSPTISDYAIHTRPRANKIPCKCGFLSNSYRWVLLVMLGIQFGTHQHSFTLIIKRIICQQMCSDSFRVYSQLNQLLFLTIKIAPHPASHPYKRMRRALHDYPPI
jgi:hypothetical protein